ncbi:MAG: 4Fe-4S cluster-binding domain-containing protein [Candidatus Lokiarchaeota archaeon]|nr:4Fe-4S cluster-binding domain-containing protein [Candidatus Lokiarchaeota archaeon]
MKLCETFRSIQGEVQGIGRQALFVRAAGCNLGSKCPVDCDTRYSWDPAESPSFFEKSAGDIDAEIAASGVSAVVITGGEPLLQQAEVVELVRLRSGIDWFVETNGTIPPVDALHDDERVYFNVSPKLPSFDPSPFPLERSIFKHVVAPGSNDFAAWGRKMESMPDAIKHRTYFMPASRDREQYLANAPAVAIWCNANGFNFGPREHMVVFQGMRGQ